MIQIAFPVIARSMPATAAALIVMLALSFVFSALNMLGSPFYPVLLSGLGWLAGYKITKNWLYATVGSISAAVIFVIIEVMGVL